jgi:hypothetical protein
MTPGLRILALATLGLLSPGLALGAEQMSAPPVLRLETGMHTAPIRAAAVDAGGHLLATASFDKTVRLWSLPTGEQLKVLRPAIGSGAEGELFAVAVSPDGRFVVAGGWTGFEWEKANSLYVFETGTGQLVRRIGGLPQVIQPARLVAGWALRRGRSRRCEDGSGCSGRAIGTGVRRRRLHRPSLRSRLWEIRDPGGGIVRRGRPLVRDDCILSQEPGLRAAIIPTR